MIDFLAAPVTTKKRSGFEYFRQGVQQRSVTAKDPHSCRSEPVPAQVPGINPAWKAKVPFLPQPVSEIFRERDHLRTLL
jgi:hypothetical protein